MPIRLLVLGAGEVWQGEGCFIFVVILPIIGFIAITIKAMDEEVWQRRKILYQVPYE